MIKKLCFVVLFMGSHVVAMESVDSSCQSQPNSPSRVDPWKAFVKEASKVLQQDSRQVQDDFFGKVIEHMQKTFDLPIEKTSDDLSPSRLGLMALFFKGKKLGESRQTIWQKLEKAKQQVDQMRFEDITIENQLLINCLLKDKIKDSKCLKTTKVCGGCRHYLKNYIGSRVVDSCCSQKVHLGVVCNVCGLKLQKQLYDQLQQLIIGFHHLGLPVHKREEIDLCKWAIFRR